MVNGASRETILYEKTIGFFQHLPVKFKDPMRKAKFFSCLAGNFAHL